MTPEDFIHSYEKRVKKFPNSVREDVVKLLKAWEKDHRKPYAKRTYDKKICVTCGKEYTPTGNTQKYCSYECGSRISYKERKKYKKNVYHLRKVIMCKYCKRQFRIKFVGQKYCSRTCSNRDKYKLTLKQ